MCDIFTYEVRKLNLDHSYIPLLYFLLFVENTKHSATPKKTMAKLNNHQIIVSFYVSQIFNPKRRIRSPHKHFIAGLVFVPAIQIYNIFIRTTSDSQITSHPSLNGWFLSNVYTMSIPSLNDIKRFQNPITHKGFGETYNIIYIYIYEINSKTNDYYLLV